MAYDQNDKDIILKYYDDLITEKGIYTPQAVGWISDLTQHVRFSVLCDVGDVSGCSVLDVGCGFGDLHNFLQKHFKDFSYFGIDINQKMIEAARVKYPHTPFAVSDFAEYAGEKYDYIFCSGALNLNIPEHKKFYFEQVRKMFEFANIAVAFNMLNAKYHPNDETFSAYTIPEVYEFCSTLSEKITIRQDYLEQDFTMYLYH